MRCGETRSSIAKKAVCLWTRTSSATKMAGKQQTTQIQAHMLPLNPSEQGLWSQTAWVQILRLPLPSSVTISRLLNLSAPVSSSVESGQLIDPTARGHCKD